MTKFTTQELEMESNLNNVLSLYVNFAILHKRLSMVVVSSE